MLAVVVELNVAEDETLGDTVVDELGMDEETTLLVVMPLLVTDVEVLSIPPEDDVGVLVEELVASPKDEGVPTAELDVLDDVAPGTEEVIATIWVDEAALTDGSGELEILLVIEVVVGGLFMIAATRPVPDPVKVRLVPVDLR